MSTEGSTTHQEAIRSEKEALFKNLHLCRSLSGNGRFHLHGNGLGPTFAGSPVFWFRGTRRDGSPSARTRKSERGSFAQQDAVDALLAFANIAEKTAPYCWANDHDKLEPEGGSCGEVGGKILREEVERFVDQFGLPHMRSDGKGPGTESNPLEARRLYFADGFEMASNARNASRRPANDARLMMERFAKDFTKLSDAEKRIGALSERRGRLEVEHGVIVDRKHRESLADDGSTNRTVFDAYLEKEHRSLGKILGLGLESDDLLYACGCAYELFTDDERDSLSKKGYIEVNADSMYRIALLFRDALDLYSAINGDEAAFNRALSKIHMEMFDVDSIESEDGCADSAVKEHVATSRYTIWFESCGFDPDNPGSEMHYASYEAQLSGCRLKLSRKRKEGRDDRGLYGCGRAVHILCSPEETPDDFKRSARKHLQDFLDGLIEEGAEHNYKGLFAKSASVDPGKPLISVNDFSTDLVCTLWSVMDMINKGEIPVKLARCEFCGRLMNVARKRGNARKVCDSSCRSQLLKRKTKGYKSKDEEIRREYLSYIESSDAVHIDLT